MISQEGRMFHVDFGFIFGKNPPKKGILVPEIRINKNMINGMGGPKSQNYIDFKLKCVSAFDILRKNRHYLLNIITMMVDAQIPNLKSQEYRLILDKIN